MYMTGSRRATSEKWVGRAARGGDGDGQAGLRVSGISSISPTIQPMERLAAATDPAPTPTGAASTPAVAAAATNVPAHPRRYALVTPCRDEAKFARRTLDSVINQTVPPALWVIVDDGSK